MAEKKARETRGKGAGDLAGLRRELKRERAERSRAEKEASYELGLMQTLLENIPDYVYFKDRSRRFVRASSYFSSLFGCSAEEIIGKRDEDLFPKEVAAETSRDDRRVIRTGIPLVNKEEGGESIGGESHWVLTTKVPWRDEKGRIIGLCGISREITDRKQMEKALRESEGKFRNLADQSPNMIFINKGGRIVYANRQCEKVTGYRKDELQSADFDFLALIAPESVPLIRKNFGKHMGGQEVEPYEYTIQNRDGRTTDVIIATKLIDYEGERAILGTVTDITLRKRSERALQERDRKLESQAANLEEMNTALKVLLDQRDREKTEFRENLLMSLERLVFPYLEKLENRTPGEDGRTYVKIVISHLRDIIAPIANSLPSKYAGFTSTEIQIADLIAQGRTSKEIAAMLNVSPKAVSFHRGNIRKKLGLANRKVSLRTYLHSFPDGSSQKTVDRAGPR